MTKTDKYSLGDADYLLTYNQSIGHNCRDYTMPCKLLGYTKSGKAKIIVFAEDGKKWFRYVEKQRITLTGSKNKMKYWHLLTPTEQQDAIARGALCSEFEQPSWCDYPDALRPGMGCWALIADYTKTIGKIEDCGKCEYIKTDE